MARIPEAVIEEILNKTDYVGILARYMRLRPQGRNFLALCPFHEEKTESFKFDPDTGLFYCFGCKEKGTFISLIRKLEGWTFVEALRELGRRVGVEVGEMSAEERRAYDHKQRIREVLERASRLFHETLTQSPQARTARDYLHLRALTPEIIAAFELGYAPPGSSSVVDWMMKKHGIPAADVIDAGLAVDRNGRAVDIFRDRITFPIRDAHGQYIAMGGRLLGDGQPKYLNSPEGILFSKRAHLYGLHQARTAMRETPAIVVEGYVDVIALHQGGFPQGVATLGTALTLEQAKLLRRYCDSCVLAYDADTAGENATDKGINVFEQVELSVRVMRIPKGEDPDSLIRAGGPEALRRLLDETLGIVEYRMQILGNRVDLRTPEGKERFLREIVPTLSKIRGPVRLEEYIRLVCHKADVSEEVVRRLLRIELQKSVAPSYEDVRTRPNRPVSGRSAPLPPRGEMRGSTPSRLGDPYVGRRGTKLTLYRRTPTVGEAGCTPPPLTPLGRAASAGVRRAEHNLLRYLLAYPAAVSTARASVPADELDDPVARTVLMHLYEMADRRNSLTLQDFVPLLQHEAGLNQEGVDRRLSELVLAKNAEPLTPELFAQTLTYFQRRREKAELQALRQLIKSRVGVSISYDDPDYIRLRELEQRLHNHGMKGS